AGAIGGLARRGDNLVGVGGDTRHALDHLLQMRCAFVIVVGDDELGILAQSLRAARRQLGCLNFHVDGICARPHTGLPNPNLIFDAAVELALVLMAAASRQNGAAWMALDNRANHLNSLLWPAQIVQPKFEKRLAGSRFTVGGFEESGWIGNTERNA